jgi:predicted metal-dependent phosphoesterase TrpH
VRADLHIHTTASDGRWTPEQVVAEVRARSIGLFAVADHDSVAHVRPAEALALRAGLGFLRGVEVCTALDGHQFHVLAYGIDVDSADLTVLLDQNRALMDRASEDALCLIASSHNLDLDGYAAYEHDPSRGGWKGLSFLIDHGLCTGVRDYFDHLAAGLPLTMPAFPHPAEAIAVIRQAGGIPVLAHPGGTLRHVGVTFAALRPFLDYGIAGLECYSNYHDPAMTRCCLDWCSHHGLIVTGGSDCHGGFAGRELGVPAVDTAHLRLGELADRIVGASRADLRPG